MKKIKYNKRYKILPFLLSFIVFILPLNSLAAESGSPSNQYWDGDLLFYDNVMSVPLNYAYSNIQKTNDDGDTLGEYKVATFNGTASNILSLTGTVGTFLNGNAQTSYTFTTSANDLGTVNVALASNSYDGLQISSLLSGIENNRTVVTIYVTFNNFEITSSTMYFPIIFDISYSTRYDEVFNVVPSVITMNASGNDWVDNVKFYTSMESLPGSKGFLARAFDSLKTHLTSLFNGLKTNDDENTQAITDMVGNSSFQITQSMSNYSYNIQNNATSNSKNEIDNATANSEAEIQQSIDNTENIMNGYNDNKEKNLVGDINNTMFDMQESESAIFDSSKNMLGEFSFPTEIPSDVLGGFSLVSSILQGIFESSGGLAWIVLASFSFVLIRMLFGLSKFMG